MSESHHRKLLVTVLAVNAGFFIVEVIAGWLASSMGLVADSLDMLADALVYGLSLAAVGRSAEKKRSVARVSGYFQMLLAVIGIAEILRRTLNPADEPSPLTMVIVSFFALIGNAVCLYLLRRERHGEVHLQASWIFTNNDVLANVGVIIAGLFVVLFQSPWPDLIIGILIFGLVMRGALRILKLSAQNNERAT